MNKQNYLDNFDNFVHAIDFVTDDSVGKRKCFLCGMFLTHLYHCIILLSICGACKCLMLCMAHGPGSHLCYYGTSSMKVGEKPNICDKCISPHFISVTA